MFHRTLQEELISSAKSYPVVTITGPRQSGKTTLVKMTFPEKDYVNLEAPDVRQRVHSDPRSFLESLKDGAILDEIQRMPELLSYIQTIVDQSDKKGLFILTGSHQMALHEAISQSLAGRTALLTLLPLSLDELQKAGFDLLLDEALFRGGYPRIFKDQLNATKAYASYFHTYVERDLREFKKIAGARMQEGFVIYAGLEKQKIQENTLLSYKQATLALE